MPHSHRQPWRWNFSSSSMWKKSSYQYVALELANQLVCFGIDSCWLFSRFPPTGVVVFLLFVLLLHSVFHQIFLWWGFQYNLIISHGFYFPFLLFFRLCSFSNFSFVFVLLLCFLLGNWLLGFFALHSNCECGFGSFMSWAFLEFEIPIRKHVVPCFVTSHFHFIDSPIVGP